MQSPWIRFALVVIVFVSVVVPARCQEVRINLLKTDDYARRRIAIHTKSGETISHVAKILTYDQENSTFTMESFSGETLKIALSDIKTIECEQQIQTQSPVAQEPRVEIYAVPGSIIKYNVSPASIRVESEGLVLPSTSSATTITPSPSAPPSEPHKQGAVIAKTDKILEGRRLIFDPLTKKLSVEVQEVTYSKEVSGSSGVSGIRK